VSVYGLAIDGRGFLWTASEPTKKIEIASNTVVDTVSHGSFYGIAIDASNRVWFGGWNGSGDMHRLDPEPPHTVLHTNLMGVTAVTVHPDGSIWGSEYGGPDYGGPPYGIVKVVLDATGTQVASAQSFPDPDGSQNHGVAVDRAGKIWSPQVWLKGTVNRWLPTGIRDTRFDVDTNQGDLYTYSDMTGIQLRTITTREGHWYQDFDSGYPNPAWDHAEWTANAPAGTSATVQFRAADSEAGFNSGTATPWCGPFAASPGAFATCPFLNGHRWMQADVKLSTTQDGLRPTFSDLKLFWAH
jgi:hypothetical protein